MTATQIASLQAEAWAATLRHVWQHSPFYRAHLEATGISAPNLPGLDQRERIPTVDKAALSQNSEALLCVPEAEVVDIVTTSGSSGQPLVWKLTERDLRRLAWNEALSFQCAGVSREDTVLLCVALDRCFIAGMAYFLGLRELGCAIVRAGPSAPLSLEMLRRARPSAVVGVPSFLCLLSDKAAEAGFDLGKLGVRKAVCIGEPIRTLDFELNRAGQKIETTWGAQAFSTYGITELAASLCECEAGRGGHLHPDLLYVEVLDEAGRPVPEGVVGEVTATTFGVEGMPLVRYRTGDCAALHREPCACGRQTPRLGPILGRKQQKLKFKGTTLFPSTLKSVLDSVEGVASYAIVARRDGSMGDSVEVLISCAGEAGAVLAELRDRFQGQAKVVPPLTPVSPERIEALQMPDGARKRRYFVDLRE